MAYPHAEMTTDPHFRRVKKSLVKAEIFLEETKRQKVGAL